MATITNSGYLGSISNTAIDGSTWTAVSIVGNNCLIHSRAGTAIKISLSATGTPYFTIPAGQSLTLDASSNSKTVYAQGAGADTVEVILSVEG